MSYKINHVKENTFDKCVKRAINELEKSLISLDGEKGKKSLYVCPACLDCETTTTPNNQSFVYIYQLAIGSRIFLFRNKLIFNFLYEILCELKHTLIIGVANTSFDLTFMYNYFYEKKFADECSFKIISPKPHHPILFEIERNKHSVLRFVDLCKMTNLPLSEIAKNYTNVKKLVGDLDYTKQRHFKTKMTITEYRYCIYDVIIGCEFLKYTYNEYTLKNKKFPLTATSIPRNKMKERFKEMKTENIIPSLFPQSVFEYLDLMNYLFRGGFVHGNKEYTAKVVENVTCSDFTSSYPAVMLQERFPMTPFKPYFKSVKFEIVDNLIPDLNLNIETTAYILDVTFINIRSLTNHSLESSEKAIELENASIDNGRINRADKLRVKLTELDFMSYQEMYLIDDMIINSIQTSVKQPLPDYVTSVLIEEYAKKAQLKIENKTDTALYMATKGVVNSSFGCMIQRLNFTNHVLRLNEETGLLEFVKYEACLDMIESKSYKKWYDKTLEKLLLKGTSETEAKNIIEKDLKNDKLLELYYNKEKASKILSPFWGIWVTAYARRRLIENMMKLEDISFDSVVYYDTDSLYVKDFETNKELQKVIHDWNKKIDNWNKKYLPELCRDLGTFDIDPVSRRFKHLGAKRYIKEVFDKKKNNWVVKQTIAGLKKGTLEKVVISDEYVTKKPELSNNDKIFNMFNFGMSVNIEMTDKLASCYINEEYSENIVDENGVEMLMTEKGGIVLQKVEFNIMTLSKFMEYSKDFH